MSSVVDDGTISIILATANWGLSFTISEAQIQFTARQVHVFNAFLKSSTQFLSPTDFGWIAIPKNNAVKRIGQTLQDPSQMMRWDQCKIKL